VIKCIKLRIWILWVNVDLVGMIFGSSLVFKMSLLEGKNVENVENVEKVEKVGKFEKVEKIHFSNQVTS